MRHIATLLSEHVLYRIFIRTLTRGLAKYINLLMLPRVVLGPKK